MSWSETHLHSRRKKAHWRIGDNIGDNNFLCLLPQPKIVFFYCIPHMHNFKDIQESTSLWKKSNIWPWDVLLFEGKTVSEMHIFSFSHVLRKRIFQKAIAVILFKSLESIHIKIELLHNDNLRWGEVRPGIWGHELFCFNCRRTLQNCCMEPPATCCFQQWILISTNGSAGPHDGRVLFTMRPFLIFINYRANCLGPSDNKCISLIQLLFCSNLFNPKIERFPIA